MPTRTKKRRNVFLFALVVLEIITIVHAVAVDAGPGPAIPDGEWSAVVDGVRGRLIATPKTLNEKPQVQIDLELENVRDLANPIEIRWTDVQTLLELSLEAENGTAAAGYIAPAGNHLTPLPYWLQLPYQSSIRFTVSGAAYEYFPDGRVWLRPLPFHAWFVTENRGRKLYVRGKLAPHKSTESGHTPWKGPLDLPRVALQ